MNLLWLWLLLGYLVIGLICLALFDFATHRVSDKFRGAVEDARTILMAQRVPANTLMATILLSIVVWIFWPAVFVGALGIGGKDK